MIIIGFVQSLSAICLLATQQLHLARKYGSMSCALAWHCTNDIIIARQVDKLLLLWDAQRQTEQ